MFFRLFFVGIQIKSEIWSFEFNFVALASQYYSYLHLFVIKIWNFWFLNCSIKCKKCILFFDINSNRIATFEFFTFTLVYLTWLGIATLESEWLLVGFLIVAESDLDLADRQTFQYFNF
jgi:hypothetical protein